MAFPLIERLVHFKVRALVFAVFWLIFFAVGRTGVFDDSDKRLLAPLSFWALLGFPVCLYAAWLWRARRRSALKTGLYEAMATVRPGWFFPKIDVYLEGDYKLLQTRRSLRIAPRFKGFRKVPVFIGGEDTDMIAIFPRGRFFKDRLHTVPVKEIEPDTD